MADGHSARGVFRAIGGASASPRSGRKVVASAAQNREPLSREEGAVREPPPPRKCMIVAREEPSAQNLGNSTVFAPHATGNW